MDVMQQDPVLARVKLIAEPWDTGHGGYPELHLDTLAANGSLRQALRGHHQAGKPLYAECGGLLYTLESLADNAGHRAPMLGLLPGHAVLQSKLVSLGMQAVELPEGELRGHTFHHSKLCLLYTSRCV